MALIRVSTNGIADDAVTTDKYVEYPPYRNLIINGDMSIAQRGTSASVSGNGASYDSIDRFKYQRNAVDQLVTTVSQSTDVPTGQGFAKSLKLDVTTAETAIDTNEYVRLTYALEGQNLQHLKYGTSSAENLTLSFWIKSSKTGNYGITFYRDEATDRMNTNNVITISSADTWEKKTFTIDGDTASTITNDNAGRFYLFLYLMAGSDYTSSTSTGWKNLSGSTLASGHTATWGTSTSDDLYITGVQLEVGTSASDFEFLPYDVNLQRCQRYYYKHADASGGNQIISVGFYESSSVIFGVVDFPVTMRTGPSNVSASGTNYYDIYSGGNDNFDSLSSALGSAQAAGFFSTQGSGTTGQAGSIRTNRTDAYVAFDAEL